MSQIEKPTRIGNLPWPDVEPGDLYVERSRISDRFDGVVDLLHVMSVRAGGQIRGYRRRERATEWLVWLPAYEGDWSEMDQAVANLLRERVVGLSAVAYMPEASQS